MQVKMGNNSLVKDENDRGIYTETLIFSGKENRIGALFLGLSFLLFICAQVLEIIGLATFFLLALPCLISACFYFLRATVTVVFVSDKEIVCVTNRVGIGSRTELRIGVEEIKDIEHKRSSLFFQGKLIVNRSDGETITIPIDVSKSETLTNFYLSITRSNCNIRIRCA